MSQNTWNEWLEQWGMTSLKLSAGFQEREREIREADKEAAWDLYIELVTRTATQPLAPGHGVEKAALDSVYALFQVTRETIKQHGRHCGEFSTLAIAILNQKVRPFTAKWHRLSSDGAFQNEATCREFRSELADLQTLLRRYARMLAEMADAEDFTGLEEYETPGPG